MKAFTFITIILYSFSSIGYLFYFFLQKNYFHKISISLICCGFLLQLSSIIYKSISIGHIPINNLYHTLLLVGTMITFGFLIFQYRFNLKILGVFISPLITSISIITASIYKEQYIAISNVVSNFWLNIHVIVIFMGETFFILAFGIAILYIIQEYTIKNKHNRFIFKRLPSLEMLDSLGYRCIVIAFTMLSIGLISGFIYAKYVWGKFWGWDPKEVWSSITWLFYAVLIHKRIVSGWHGKKSAIMAIIGFMLILFTFLGVNFLLEGHHKDFTKW